MKKFKILIAICLSFVLTNEIQAQGVEITAGGKIEFVSTTSLEIQNGNFINNGTYTKGSETITFSGSSNGNISGSSNNDIYSLTVNNTNGVSLIGTGYFAINKTLTFTVGLLNTGTNEVIINDNANVTGANTSNYINGNCRKVGNDAFVFPIGKSGKYAPIGISAPGNITDNFTAVYYKDNPNPLYSVNLLGAGINNVSVKEYWTLDRTNGSSNVNVTLNWDNSSGVSLVNDIRVARWDGSKWTDAGSTATTGNSTLGSVTSGVVSTFSPFTLGSATVNNPLPVELMSFSAECDNDKVAVKWSTVTETNCDYFIVDKMYEGEKFSQIAKIRGSGNSNQIINYQIEDNSTKNQVTYYRLTQVDFSGIADVMDERIVATNCNVTDNTVNAFQNNESLNIIISSVNENIIISIYDLNGRLITKYSKVLYDRENKINLIDFKLSEGMYIANIQTANNAKSVKLIIR